MTNEEGFYLVIELKHDSMMDNSDFMTKLYRDLTDLVKNAGLAPLEATLVRWTDEDTA